MPWEMIRTSAGFPASTSCTPSTTVCAVCGLTMSIFIRFTDSIRHADRRDTRSAQRCRPRRQGSVYRRIVHVRLAVPENAARLGRFGLGPLRHHAEPLQPGLSRRRARDDSPMPGRGHRPHSLEPPRSRLPRRKPEHESSGETVRAKTDEYAKSLYYRDSDFTVVDRVTEIAKKREVNNAQVALAWMLSKPGSPLPSSGPARCIISTMRSKRS